MFKYKRSVLFLILLSLAFALIAGGKLPYFLFYTVLLVTVVSYLWTSVIVRRLKITQRTAKEHACVGEDIELQTHVSNRSFLPIPFIEVINEAYKRITGAAPRGSVIFIKPFGSKIITHNLKCKYRGVYHLGPVSISISDIFGIFAWNRTLNCDGELRVYPRVAKLKAFPIKPARTYGTATSPHKMYEDGYSISDIKKYHPGDSFRKIHWKVSARKGSLNVRNFDMCGNEEEVVFLNFNSLDFNSIYRLDIEEKAVECAAAVIFYALHNNIDTSLYVNCSNTVDTKGKDLRDFRKFMQEFIVIKSDGLTSFSELLGLKSKSLTRGSTVVLITPHIDKASIDRIIQLKEKRFDVIIIYIAMENLSEDYSMILSNIGIKLYKVEARDDVKTQLEG